jgi:hypothetical protein
MSQNRHEYELLNNSEAQDAWRGDAPVGLGGHERQMLEEQVVALATVEQKKRIWWRSVFINSLFMGSW